MLDEIKSRFAGGSIPGNALRIYIFQFLGLAVGLVSGIIVARILGPEDKGILNLYALTISIVRDFGLLGIGSGLLFYIANRNKPLEQIHSIGLVYSIAAGLIAGTVGILGLQVWRQLLPNIKDWIILLAFFLSAFAFYHLIWTNVMTGINEAVTTFRFAFYFACINMVVVVTLWLTGALNVTNVILLNAAILTVGAIVVFIVLRNKHRAPLKYNHQLAGKCMKYGLAVYLGVVVNIMHFKIDQFMINYWLGSESVGVYAVSVRWAEMLFFLDTGLILGSLHKISSLNAGESYNLAKKLFRIQILISSGAGLLLVFLAYPIVHKLYGLPYAGAVVPMMILIPGVITWSVSRVLSTHLVYNRKLAIVTSLIAFVGLVINVVLNYFLIRSPMAISGAALASTISYAFVMATTAVVFLMLRVKD